MNSVEVIVDEDGGSLARRAADVVQEYLGSTPDPVLGLATGASVRPLYRELIRRHRRERLSFRRVRSFLLDDYIGLGPEHPQCYGNLIEAEFARRVDIIPENLHVPDCGAVDLDLECDRYDRQVTRVGVGLQILGVGRNGHLAFNEPGSSFESRTRVVRLAADTRADNARYFDGPDQVPAHAMTQGMATIGQAAHLLVLAAGPSKSEAVRAALEGPITSAVPASALRLHSRVTVLLDPSAARLTGLGG